MQSQTTLASIGANDRITLYGLADLGNYFIMRFPTFSADDLRRFFSERLIGTLGELKGALGSTATSTVWRKLRQLEYLTSYSHRGAYYTLRTIPRFDQHGLWQHRSVRFSRHGNLITTCQALVDQSPAGLNASELDALLGVECKRALLQLFNDGQVKRRKFEGVYVYLARDLSNRRCQQGARTGKATREAMGLSAGANPEEVCAAMVLFFSVLDEKQRRLFAGLESLKHGYGGDRFVAEWLGLDPHTVAKGRRKLLEGEVLPGRVRREGAGRKSAEKKRLKSSPRSNDS